MSEKKFTWVETHKQLTKFLSSKENSQIELIELLKSIGIGPFNDKTGSDEHDIELEEIDPFTFFCYIYKYGVQKRLIFLQEIAKKINIYVPEDEKGLPSAQPLKVWLFPYKFERTNNEVPRLWKFFNKAITYNITNKDFEDVLQIRSTGKTKITEALFYINPERYLPINGPTKPYIKEKLGINPIFNSFSEYESLLEQIKSKINIPFYEISYKAWEWLDKKKKVNYWIFQGNPNVFDFETALREGVLEDWTVNAHKDKIKAGDKVILWITGNKSGCYALAKVNSEPYVKHSSPDDHLWKEENKNELKADIGITHNLVDMPILKGQIENIAELSNLKVGSQGTNFTASQEEFEAILKTIENMKQRKYWLYAPGDNASKWDEFYEQGIMGLGWDEIGDLNKLGDRNDITKAIQNKYNTESKSYNNALANLQFRDIVSIGDVIIPKRGRQDYLGYGIVVSDYYYDLKRDSYQKCRKVEWRKKGVWPEPNGDIVPKTLTDITKYPDYVKKLINLIGIEEGNQFTNGKSSIMEYPLNTILYGPPGTGKTYQTIIKAAEIIENRKIESYDEAKEIFQNNLHDRIEFITFHQNYSYEDFIQGLRPDTENDKDLNFKKRDGIFTQLADRALKNLKESQKAPEDANQSIAFSDAIELLKDKIIESDKPIKINDTAYFIAVEDDAFRYTGENWTLNDKGFNGFRMKYSDLIRFFEEDIKERKAIKNLDNISGLAKQHASYFFKTYELIKTLMTNVPKKSEVIPRKNYVIVIDEINRANISRVFGELITLIEPDKRSHGDIPIEATLPSGDKFVVPSNLYLIGTMNTADKSIALLDIALRRRFEFEAMYPIYEISEKEIYDVEILQKINEQIIKTKGHDFQIGHAYFMGENNDLIKRMNKKVLPLLLEYYMNDAKEVINILTKAGLKVDETVWPIKIIGRND